MDAQVHTADLQEHVGKLKMAGLDPEKWFAMIDSIINGDLADKDFKRSGKPVADSKDRQKEINRIINNYGLALKTVAVEGDNEEKIIFKFMAVAGAAKSGLTALGLSNDQINATLGLDYVMNEIMGGSKNG